MKTFSQFIGYDLSNLDEAYKNFFLRDKDKREKYKDEVFDILQKSYAKIGGLKSGGFSSPDDMVNKIPFWKLAIKNGKVVAVVMYKDKQGRKSVASGTDGSDEGKKKLIDIIRGDLSLGRAYSERSKAMLAVTLKQYPEEVMKNLLLTPSDVKKLMPNDDIEAITDVPESEWTKDVTDILSKYPFVKEYGYFHTIGTGDKLFKVALGTPNKKIF